MTQQNTGFGDADIKDMFWQKDLMFMEAQRQIRALQEEIKKLQVALNEKGKNK